MTDEKKKKVKKVVLTVLGVGAVGFAGYWGWQQYQKRKNENGDDVMPEVPSMPSASFSNHTPIQPQRNDQFPLKKGSKGDKVRQLQETLIAKYGKAILPMYGADGDFGSEMVTALQAKGLPITVDESTFNALVKARSFNPDSLARTIYNAAIGKKFTEVISALKQLRTTSDYSAVSEIFKNNYRIGAVRQTLVNGLLNVFTVSSQKDSLQMEFIRMGLKYDGDKWSLSGLPQKRIITTRPTKVWANQFTSVDVPANTVLGEAIATKNGYTLFQTFNNQKLITPTNSIKYYENN